MNWLIQIILGDLQCTLASCIATVMLLSQIIGIMQKLKYKKTPWNYARERGELFPGFGFRSRCDMT